MKDLLKSYFRYRHIQLSPQFLFVFFTFLMWFGGVSVDYTHEAQASEGPADWALPSLLVQPETE